MIDVFTAERDDTAVLECFPGTPRSSEHKSGLCHQLVAHRSVPGRRSSQCDAGGAASKLRKGWRNSVSQVELFVLCVSSGNPTALKRNLHCCSRLCGGRVIVTAALFSAAVHDYLSEVHRSPVNTIFSPLFTSSCKKKTKTVHVCGQ